VHPHASGNDEKFVLFTDIVGDASFIQMTDAVPSTFRNLATIKCDIVSANLESDTTKKPVRRNKHDGHDGHEDGDEGHGTGEGSMPIWMSLEERRTS
jgi:hypothetical protein